MPYLGGRGGGEVQEAGPSLPSPPSDWQCFSILTHSELLVIASSQSDTGEVHSGCHITAITQSHGKCTPLGEDLVQLIKLVISGEKCHHGAGARSGHSGQELGLLGRSGSD